MIPIKIEQNKFNKIRYLYLKKINDVFVDGRIKEEGKKTIAQRKVYQDINNELKRIGINKTLGEIIIADFKTLKGIKQKLDLFGQVYEAYDDKKNIIPKNKLVKYSQFNILYNIFDNKLEKQWLIEELGINVCPYCNRNFINNLGKKTSAQLDHFFPRSKYPIFALSICNLIPSCYSCNHIKSSNEIEVSPYDNKYNFDKSIRFSYTPKSYNYFNDYNQLDIEIISEKAIQKNIDTMNIDEGYKIHRDYVQEILKKAELYNNYKLKEYLNNYKNLFSSEEEILRIVFGNYVNLELLGNRPLAKLTKDILDELGIKI
ncbi:HNH endonuclease [Clostridium butyricum]|uniref:HNH endonuclease n=1 Tax=Clostridium butyricum TaxID=1492 RepID=UPI003D34415C